MLNNYEDAFLWYRDNAHRIDRFEFVDDDGTRRPLTNVEMYWLTQIKRAEEDGVDVPTDPHEQLVQVLGSMDDDSPDPVVVRLERENEELRKQLEDAQARNTSVPDGFVGLVVELNVLRAKLAAAEAALARIALSETGDKCWSDFAQDFLRWKSTSELWDIIKAAQAGGGE